MFIIKHKYFFFSLSILLVLSSLFSIAFFHPWNFGIEFTGGSLLEVGYPNGRPDAGALKEKLATLNWVGTQVQETGADGFLVRTKDLSEPERQQLMSVVSDNGGTTIEERRFNSIGPTVGNELRTKAGWAILCVILAIVLYIAFAFRGVSHPISSWTYGIVAIVALVHDVLIPTGIYVALGHYYIDVQIDVLFVTAILTILGFSVHDTIVVFDRTRENLKLRTWKEFSVTVGHSIEQTFARSINTSMTVLLVILALYFVGGETTKNFALILAIGVIAGTYSSIFVASPLLVAVEEWQRKKEAKHSKKK
ncbi:MAG: protein-export membrane protein SecF [Candidatus Lloydbacteria bacterium RIFCSPHIGHO2_01_FULL_49_22]|uniref:Protein-export membrane protein SecF n=1 Tax=Candidatus Lloydbacteria bacterium RIFCSPHIGHO2_01_FULL_49_22 TaxID=1798658 RepID=A0A1G2CW24_9BACT|nr:MAG: protein-export membrane protein SecF [Candidatus Lloydbacteria bacterium RIFCSPHIGHO2_01_FULL_49_22]OGZ09555.1 MAG: protein-export membrane protein SecF [Candidatus Lloydbacteria bacterium RIFCSPHIGHO2_02_FULL_50_18]